jgi:hypothetical protein
VIHGGIQTKAARRVQIEVRIHGGNVVQGGEKLLGQIELRKGDT